MPSCASLVPAFFSRTRAGRPGPLAAGVLSNSGTAVHSRGLSPVAAWSAVGSQIAGRLHASKFTLPLRGERLRRLYEVCRYQGMMRGPRERLS